MAAKRKRATATLNAQVPTHWQRMRPYLHALDDFPDGGLARMVGDAGGYVFGF